MHNNRPSMPAQLPVFKRRQARVSQLALILVLVAPMALSLGACCEEEIVCDERGCFSCDGASCRPLDTDERGACRGDFECAEGEACTESGCIETCSTEATDCEGKGLACDEEAELCLFPGEEPPESVPGTCDTQADCEGDDLICLEGLCAFDPVCPEGACLCDEETPCADGFQCAAGRCQADDETCRFDTDCSEDGARVCLDGQCLETCEGDAVCSGSFACGDQGVCEPDETGECTGAGSCAEDALCVNSNCVPTCEDDDACGEGEYCTTAGFCEVDTRPVEDKRCEVDSDCPSFCILGICRFMCGDPTDPEALRCAQQQDGLQCVYPIEGDRGICVDEELADTDCETAIDCPANEICANGFCTP